MICRKLLLLSLLTPFFVHSQSLSPQVIASAGGSGSTANGSLDWTTGETITTTVTNGSSQLTQGFHQPPEVKVKINLLALLEGPFDPSDNTMADHLRVAGYVPLTEPYTALGYLHINDVPKPTTALVLSNNAGKDAIVDWIYLQLRDKNDNTVVTASRCALMQRDGDVVDVDGISEVKFNAAPDDHYIAVFHRNHLAVVTFSAITLGDAPVSIDLTDGSIPTYGTDAQKIVAGTRLLWAGDVTADGVVKYTGSGNDRDPILVEIGGSIPTNTTTGYHQEDVNMNGTVQYTGSGNDRDPILVNIGGSVPTNTRIEQMP